MVDTVNSSMAFIVNGDEILLLKRVSFPFIGLWALPGGKLEEGETIQQSIVREIMEETGIKAEFDSIRGTVSEDIVEAGETICRFNTHLCTLKIKNMENMRPETPGQELRWFDLNRLDYEKERLVPSDYYMIKHMLLRGERGHFESLIEKNGNCYDQKRFERIEAGVQPEGPGDREAGSKG